MNRGRAQLLTLALTCVVLGACTGPTSSPAGPTPPGGATQTPAGPAVTPGGANAGACATLTTAEISATIGLPVKDGRATSSGNDPASKCEWDAQDETIGVFTEVDLLPFDATLWDMQKTATTSEPVANLGEEAFRWQVGSLGPAGILEIKYHGYEIDITVFGPSSDKNTVAGQQVALANLVLSRV